MVRIGGSDHMSQRKKKPHFWLVQIVIGLLGIAVIVIPVVLHMSIHITPGYFLFLGALVWFIVDGWRNRKSPADTGPGWKCLLILGLASLERFIEHVIFQYPSDSLLSYFLPAILGVDLCVCSYFTRRAEHKHS